MLNSLHTDAALHPMSAFKHCAKGLRVWGSGHHVYAGTGIRHLKEGPSHGQPEVNCRYLLSLPGDYTQNPSREGQ